MNSGAAGHALVACEGCDLLHHVKPLPPGTAARCTRCGGPLAQHRRNSIDRTLAWTLASLLLFVLANTFPILLFEMAGREQQNELFSGCIELNRQGYWPLAALVFLASVLAPAVRIAGLLYVLVPVKFGRRPLRLVPIFRLAEVLEPWSMLEVFMLGMVVAIIKLSGLAEVVMGIGLYAFMGLIVTSTAAVVSLDPELIWRRAKPSASARAAGRRTLMESLPSTEAAT